LNGLLIDFGSIIIDQEDPTLEAMSRGFLALQERIRQERIIHALGLPLTNAEFQLISASSAGIELVLA